MQLPRIGVIFGKREPRLVNENGFIDPVATAAAIERIAASQVALEARAEGYQGGFAARDGEVAKLHADLNAACVKLAEARLLLKDCHSYVNWAALGTNFNARQLLARLDRFLEGRGAAK